MAIICAIMAVFKKVKCFYRAGLKSFSHLSAEDFNTKPRKLIFFLAHSAAAVYIPYSDDLLIFKTDVKVLHTRKLRETDGDGV